jgi:hypothetical protein
MVKNACVEIPPEKQAQMLAMRRRMRPGYQLALHILLLCAAGCNPIDIAAVLFCSHSRVYRTVRAYQAGTLGLEPDDGPLRPPIRTTALMPTRRRALMVLFKATPQAYGWCRTPGVAPRWP